MIFQKMADHKYKITRQEINRRRVEALKREMQDVQYNKQAKEDPRQTYFNSLYLLNATGKEAFYCMANIGCDDSWPICTFDLTFKKRAITHFAFTIGRNITGLIRDDYFYTENKKPYLLPEQTKKHRKRTNSICPLIHPPDILIERHAHYCDKSFVAKLICTLEAGFDESKVRYIYGIKEMSDTYICERDANVVNERIKERVIEVVDNKDIKSSVAHISKHHSLERHQVNNSKLSKFKIPRFEMKINKKLV
jgi:hypothetical protein